MPSKPLSVAPILVVVVGLFSGLAAAQKFPPPVNELVARTRAQIHSIDMATFKSGLDKGDLGVIIDVREPAEYAEGHIPGAIDIPRGQIEFRIWTLVGFPGSTNLSKQITLYCGTGERSALATKALQDLGFSTVVAADMKLEDWVRAEYPLEMK